MKLDEKALSIFSKKANPPKIIGYETRTIAVIYFVFALVYTLTILQVPSKSQEHYAMWKEVLDTYDK